METNLRIAHTARVVFPIKFCFPGIISLPLRKDPHLIELSFVWLEFGETDQMHSDVFVIF